MPTTPLVETPFQWWLARLPLYNVGLAVAGIVAFILYVIVGSLLVADFELNLLFTIVQGIGYLVLMGVANVCYMIGPISESVLRPDDVWKYRLRWFDVGCRFSFSLPFCVPVLVIISAVLQWFLGHL
ncbi:MAG: hypothetical protein ACO1TE_27985 [Prosthecobacter sp.]